jgi:hypothetical protein
MNTQLLRFSLSAGVPFNIVAAALLAFPNTKLGQLLQLPANVPTVYSIMLGYLVFMFGCAYGWMALQETVNKPLLCFCAIGKCGVFVLAVILYGLSEAKLAMVLTSSGDLILGALWFYWLWSHKASAA